MRQTAYVATYVLRDSAHTQSPKGVVVQDTLHTDPPLWGGNLGAQPSEFEIFRKASLISMISLHDHGPNH